ncbi:hypothetical protein TNCV_3420591 [Trichonephila clavipes]|nr:hypothetical protein TNCV_3420591 [Trichonephila clavipes]
MKPRCRSFCIVDLQRQQGLSPRLNKNNDGLEFPNMTTVIVARFQSKYIAEVFHYSVSPYSAQHTISRTHSLPSSVARQPWVGLGLLKKPFPVQPSSC